MHGLQSYGISEIYEATLTQHARRTQARDDDLESHTQSEWIWPGVNSLTFKGSP